LCFLTSDSSKAGKACTESETVRFRVKNRTSHQTSMKFYVRIRTHTFTCERTL